MSRRVISISEGRGVPRMLPTGLKMISGRAGVRRRVNRRRVKERASGGGAIEVSMSQTPSDTAGKEEQNLEVCGARPKIESPVCKQRNHEMSQTVNRTSLHYLR